MSYVSSLGGATLSQTPAAGATHSAAVPPAHQPSRVLLNAPQAAREVYGVSERQFHNLRAQGLVPDPIVLGPRTLRWVRSELEAAAMNMPRQREAKPQPTQLALAKARLKAGTATQAGA